MTTKTKMAKCPACKNDVGFTKTGGLHRFVAHDRVGTARATKGVMVPCVGSKRQVPTRYTHDDVAATVAGDSQVMPKLKGHTHTAATPCKPPCPKAMEECPKCHATRIDGTCGNPDCVELDMRKPQRKPKQEDLVNGWARAEDFCDYLETTLIPDLKASGHAATADDFETAVAFMRKVSR